MSDLSSIGEAGGLLWSRRVGQNHVPQISYGQNTVTYTLTRNPLSHCPPPRKIHTFWGSTNLHSTWLTDVFSLSGSLVTSCVYPRVIYVYQRPAFFHPLHLIMSSAYSRNRAGKIRVGRRVYRTVLSECRVKVISILQVLGSNTNYGHLVWRPFVGFLNPSGQMLG
jgi:hypothetical protein